MTSQSRQPYVYDKGKYHDETVDRYGLSEEHAANHTVVFLRWLIERDLMSESFRSEGGDGLEALRAGRTTIHEIYNWWDRCLVDDMLSDEGNAFAMHYFDFERGQYIHDYIRTLQRRLPSEFHVEYSEKNYQAMKAVIDRRFDEWKNPRRPWRPFGRTSK